MLNSKPFLLPSSRPNSKTWKGNVAKPEKIGSSGTEVLVAPLVPAVVMARPSGTAPTALLRQTLLLGLSAAQPTRTRTPPASLNAPPATASMFLRGGPCQPLPPFEAFFPDLIG